MTLHIGIVACSAEGAALCYRTICEKGAQRLGPYAHPEVSMHTNSLADYMKCIDGDDWRGVGELMLDSEVVNAHAAERGFRRIGLTGTKWLVASDVYPQTYVRPTAAEREEINRIIMDELVCGIFKTESIAYLQRVIASMKDAGCDAVVLGCTEIPLIISDTNSPLPTLDSTRLLARAALQRAITSSSPA